MCAIGNILALFILMGLSVMDIRIRKVPRDVLILCMISAVIYQILTDHVDWRLSLAGGAVGLVFLWFSKITNEVIGYGDSMAILVLGIYLGVWQLMAVLVTAFFILSVLGIGCLAAGRAKIGMAFPFYPFLTVGYLFGVFVGGM